jgi:aconitate hydratase
MSSMRDHFQTKATLRSRGGSFEYFSLPRLGQTLRCRLERLPRTIRVLLESALRSFDDYIVTPEHIAQLCHWGQPGPGGSSEIPFMPARVLLQDFTGVPAVVDLAAMRSAIVALGGDSRRINPQVAVDLVIDHSVQVDHFASSDALQLNVRVEFERNRERYEFLHWGQQTFANFRVVPPNTGIVHQVNLEYLASVAAVREEGGRRTVLPDSLVGTDSHTTMINGLGVVGWGVGGIEAEAVMLGQPIYMLMPQVVGMRLSGRLQPGATATDLVLTVTQMLRKHGVVDKFVEFYGEGLAGMSLPDRATIANMAPEYGATVGYFPVDGETLDYLNRTGRAEEQVDLVERYYKEQGLFRTSGEADPEFSETLELDLAGVTPSLAGPKRPQDLVPLPRMKDTLRSALRAPLKERGYALSEADLQRRAVVSTNGSSSEIGHGAVVIAAITSCTNTSNPSVMVAAGLLARKAVQRGLQVRKHVKTSLAPGSRVVTAYLDKAGLTGDLEKLGFYTVGYGCTTCIGNSGPLPEAVGRAIEDGGLVACAVLSGNRNFEGRVHPQVKANFLASPPLVVAYALAGTTDIDLTREPLGKDRDGRPVYLKDIWPNPEEVTATIGTCVTPELFKKQYADVFSGNATWNAISASGGEVYEWNEASTYIQEPPFFKNFALQPPPIRPIGGARVLVMVGDSVTTDHISPAGSIAADSPAGRYLQEHGVQPRDFNSYGSRRGNDRVMTRGTFSNIRLKNLLVPGTEGGITLHLPSEERLSIFDAAERYHAENTPLVVLAGRDYGMGSSRDWAAKGALLLGVRVVIAASFERIHRSNLVGMGVLPLQFAGGQDAESLGLTGREQFGIAALDDRLRPQQQLEVLATADGGGVRRFMTTVRVDTPVELDYYRHGGILPMVLRSMLKEKP